MESLNLAVSGMSCGHCVARVEKALKGIVGVTVVSVGIGAAAISFDPQKTSPAVIAQAVSDVGYPATPVENAP